MISINKTKITSEEYKKVEEKIDSILLEPEILKTHKKLVGKYYIGDENQIVDCGINYIEKLLTRDYERSIVFSYTQGAKNFIQSEYLSKYIKKKIKEFIIKNKINTDAIRILNSNIAFNDMTCEQIRDIYYAIFKVNDENYKNTDIAKCLIHYLYKLDGKGAKDFIIKYFDSNEIGKYILSTSGLITRTNYYAGRGVTRGDLNERNLIAIFGKLLKLNPKYAKEYFEMVSNIETLSAAEFIKAFLDFSSSNFEVNTSHCNKKDNSLDTLSLESVMMSSEIQMLVELNKKNDLGLTKQIKISFLKEIYKVFSKEKSNIEYIEIDTLNNIGKCAIR